MLRAKLVKNEVALFADRRMGATDVVLTLPHTMIEYESGFEEDVTNGFKLASASHPRFVSRNADCVVSDNSACETILAPEIRQ